MALKGKSNDTDKSSNDENSKIKSYITRQFKKFMRMSMQRDLIKTVSSPVHLSSRIKIEEGGC